MTTKSYVVKHPLNGAQSVKTKSGGDPGYNYVWSSLDVGTTNSRTTDPDSIPDYRERIRRGQDATTNLEAWSVRTSYSTGQFSLLAKLIAGNTYLREAILGPKHLNVDVSLFDSPSQALQNRALQKFLEEYRSNISMFMGGVATAEIRQTIALITHPGKIIRKGLDSYYDRAKKRASRGPKKNLSKDLSNLWLEYRFGVQPLLQDIDDASRALANSIYNRRPRAQIKGTAAEKYSVPPSKLSGAGLNALFWDVYEKTEYEISYRYKGSMWLDTGTPTQVISSLGFSPVDWLPTVWELIPYSFVIDYFTNIGDLISAWSYGTTQIRWSVLTYRSYRLKVRTYENIRMNNPSYSQLSLDTSSAASTSAAARHVVRVANPSLVPSFEFRIPGLGSTRWINLAALIAQRDRQSHNRF